MSSAPPLFPDDTCLFNLFCVISTELKKHCWVTDSLMTSLHRKTTVFILKIFKKYSQEHTREQSLLKNKLTQTYMYYLSVEIYRNDSISGPSIHDTYIICFILLRPWQKKSPSSNLNLFGPGDFVGVPGEYESSCIKITITDTIIAPSARWCAQ